MSQVDRCQRRRSGKRQRSGRDSLPSLPRQFTVASSDSGVFLLDPEDRALLKACREACRKQEGTEAHTREAGITYRRFLKIARELPAVRLEKVMRIRRMIAKGNYITEEKLQATVDRLLEALG